MAQQKVNSVIEQLDRGEHQVALTEINNFISKEKNLKKMQESEISMFKFLKAVCLVRNVEGYGEAKEIMLDLLVRSESSQVPQEFSIIEQIAISLHMLPDIRNFIDAYYKTIEQNEENLRKHMNIVIKENDFVGAQKLANKLYNQTKDDSILYLSIFLQTLDEKVKPNYMMLGLFMEKIMKAYKITESNFKEQIQEEFKNNPKNNVPYQIVKLQAELLLQQEKYQECTDYIMKFDFIFQENQCGLNLLQKIYEKEPKQETLEYIIKLYYELFKRNVEIERFQMVFESYQQFIELLFKNIESNSDFQQLLNNGEIQEDQVFVFKTGNNQLQTLENFYKSLNQHQQILFKNNSTHHHFKNALKAVLQSKFLVLQNIYKVNKDNFKLIKSDLLNISITYTEQFGAIFTFPEELYTSFVLYENSEMSEIRQAILDKLNVKSEKTGQSEEIKNCIKKFNQIKLDIVIFGQKKIENVTEFYNQIEPLVENYKLQFSQIYENKEIKIEKGERLWADDYLTILADMAWEIFSKFSEINKQSFVFVNQMIILLEMGLKLSPYNFDYSVRLMIYYSYFGNFDRILEIHRALDIKGVQYETLGFIFLSQGLNFELNNNQDLQNLITSALLYYNENNKESKYSMVTAIKNKNFEQLREVYQWDQWIKNSYLKYIFQYSKFNFMSSNLQKKDQLRNVNTDFYLDSIIENIENSQNLTFNIDMKQFQPIFANNRNKNSNYFKQYLGIYQSPLFMKLKTINNKLQLSIDNILDDSEKDVVILENNQNIFKQFEEILGQKEKIMEQIFNIKDNFQTRQKSGFLLKYEKLEKDLQYSEIEKQLNQELQQASLNQRIYEILYLVSECTPKTIDLFKKAEKTLTVFIEEIKETLGNILKQLESFDFKNEVFPYNLYISLNKFYQFTLKNLQILSKKQDKIKSKLMKISKKAASEKKQLTAFSKQLGNLFTSISEMTQEINQVMSQKMEAYCTGVLDNKQFEKLLLDCAENNQEGQSKSIQDVLKDFDRINLKQLIEDISSKYETNYKLMAKNMIAIAKEGAIKMKIQK